MNPAGKIMEVRIESFLPDGRGASESGKIVVPRSVPGDFLKVRVAGGGGKILYGKILEILEPSPDRVPDKCPSFGMMCGGCQWLNMNYNAQLDYKEKILRDDFDLNGIKIVKLEKFKGMEKPFGCRNKMSLLNSNGRLVFTRDDSKNGLHISDCPLEIDVNRSIFKIIKCFSWPLEILQVHIRGSLEGKAGLCLFVKRMTRSVHEIARRIIKEIPDVKGIMASSYRFCRMIEGIDNIKTKINGITYGIPLNGFFQTNFTQAEFLLNSVLDLIDEGPPAILDLYCGSGFFSLSASRKTGRVLGIDFVPESVKSACINASINGITNCDFIAGDVEKVIRDIKPGKFITVIIDPPREGCGRRVLREISRINPRDIIYVSCSPGSLAADLKDLQGLHYKAVYSRGIDMFPHTIHMEAVVKLTKAG